MKVVKIGIASDLVPRVVIGLISPKVPPWRGFRSYCSLSALPIDHRGQTRTVICAGVLPRKRLKDSLTVPCCYQCNNDSHEDDEYLRVAATACYNSNPVGKKTWEQKTVGSTVRKKRLTKSIDKMAASLKRIALITPEGKALDAVEGKIDGARVDRVLTRMTKGFLSRLYPEIERSELSFQVEQIDQFKLNDPLFRSITRLLFRFQRGHAVFRCWHGVEEYSHTGVWVHMFFDSAVYVVSHTSDRRIVMPW